MFAPARLTILFRKGAEIENMRTGLSMRSTDMQMKTFALRENLLPVIVGIVIIVNIGILTGIPRFG
jgi:hypothetical protein